MRSESRAKRRLHNPARRDKLSDFSIHGRTSSSWLYHLRSVAHLRNSVEPAIAIAARAFIVFFNQTGMIPPTDSKSLICATGKSSRQNLKQATSLTWMSISPKPPERLAEILLEILALSDSTRTNQSESVSGSDPIESFDTHRIKEQSQRRGEEDNNRQ